MYTYIYMYISRYINIYIYYIYISIYLYISISEYIHILIFIYIYICFVAFLRMYHALIVGEWQPLKVSCLLQGPRGHPKQLTSFVFVFFSVFKLFFI